MLLPKIEINLANLFSETHQRAAEVPLPGCVVDAGEELVKVGPFLYRLLPKRVCATHISCRDDLQ